MQAFRINDKLNKKLMIVLYLPHEYVSKARLRSKPRVSDDKANQ